MIIFEQKFEDNKCTIPPITEMSINQFLVIMDDLLKKHNLEVAVEQFESLTTSFWVQSLDEQAISGGHRIDTSKIIPV